MEPTNEHIAVLGGGTWGATLAGALAGMGHDVALWEYSAENARRLAEERTLANLPALRLPASVKVSHHIEETLRDRNVVFSVTPSFAVRSTFSARSAQRHLKRGALVVTATKGLETETQLTMSQVIHEIFTEAGDIVILSGPSHAEEVAAGHPVALVAASTSTAATGRVQAMMRSEAFRIYTSDDPVGVELGGALKNIYAVACGIADGLSLGDNVKAAMVTRALAEMTRLGIGMGAAATTFFGLSGLGDLYVTTMSRHSRNRNLGELIGRGNTLEEALQKLTMVAEGVNTTKSAQGLAQRLKVEMPIVNEMYHVLFEKKSPRDSMKDLLARQAGSEMEGIVV